MYPDLGLTVHAYGRGIERDIPYSDIHLVERYATRQLTEKGLCCQFTGREVWFRTHEAKHGARLLDIVVILSADGSKIITVYREN